MGSTILILHDSAKGSSIVFILKVSNTTGKFNHIPQRTATIQEKNAKRPRFEQHIRR
jgi:hypothetical protein